MRKHTGERPYPCKFCGRRFTDSSTRIKHERTHTNERPFACHLCGKSFTASYILKNHMLTHTGEKEFKCDLCNREFGRKTNLDAHFTSKMHKEAVTGVKLGRQFQNRIKCKNERRYVCSVCGKSFAAPYILRNHMLTHTGVKDFKCDACNKAFARKSQLDAHFTTKIHKQSVENNEYPEFQE
ncbi:hypothetical protein DOY81_013041 [Sarcophaga bullata]|nr:hypothetical protein DOY81_013041 [Sarcophaga bullata]